MTTTPFHLAFPVTDLDATRAFYTEVLGASVGRQSDLWIDFNFFGHQITAHLAPPEEAAPTNPVDGKAIPVRHFGVILPWEDWHEMAARLTDAGLTFLVTPGIRFQGRVGEQATFFITDPSGNGLEFKSFKDPSQIFAS